MATQRLEGKRQPQHLKRRGLIGFAAAIAGVAAMTALIYLIPGADRIASISLLYLLVVISAAVTFGSGPAVLASILSFLAFDWFFVEPRYHFTVADPAEWLALLVFLVTALSTGHLTALLRAQAEEARRRERETAALAEASWAVASQVDREHALAEVLWRIAQVIPLRAAAILDPRDRETPYVLARWGDELPDFSTGSPLAAVQFVLAGGQPVAWSGDRRHWEKALVHPAQPGTAYLPLTTKHHVLGTLYLRLAPEHLPTAQERRVVESLANLPRWCWSGRSCSRRRRRPKPLLKPTA